MVVAGALTAAALDAVAEVIRPGMTPLELNTIADAVIRDGGGTPNFIGVPGHLAPFEHATCISINDEVVHGIPDDRVIEAGQIVSVDCGADVDGWNGDSARTFLMGDVPAAARQLSEVTRAGMLAGVCASFPGATLEDVAGAIEDVGLKAGYGIVRGYVGHGIGNEMHEEPQVPNFSNEHFRRTGEFRLIPGRVLAVEPMVNMGRKRVRVETDHWTQSTADGKPSAHFEHTIAITESGTEVLTAGPNREGWGVYAR